MPVIGVKGRLLEETAHCWRMPYICALYLLLLAYFSPLRQGKHHAAESVRGLFRVLGAGHPWEGCCLLQHLLWLLSLASYLCFLPP
jgi:hypothetical protein